MSSMMAAFPERVRTRVLAEHAALRRGLATLTRASISAHEGIFGGVAGMRDAVRDLREAFERHLGYEEQEVLPLLLAADAWGPIRVTHVLDDHHAQRAMLAALVEDVTAGAKPIDELLEEIAWLTRGLLADMAAEE